MMCVLSWKHSLHENIVVRNVDVVFVTFWQLKLEAQENNLKKSFEILGRLILVCYFIVYQFHVNRIYYGLTTVTCMKVPFLVVL
jgi:hypothetical protein